MISKNDQDIEMKDMEPHVVAEKGKGKGSKAKA